MVCANTRVADALSLIGAVLYKVFCPKRCVVDVIFLYRDAVFVCPSLKFMLGLQCFTNTERNLMGVTDHS